MRAERQSKPRLFWAGALILLMPALCVLWAGSRKPAEDAQTVDSGSFSIFVKGRRVGTESFRIEQRGDTSTTTSELKVSDGSNQASQSSELQLSSTGALLRYQWRELSPGKAQAVVMPNDQFLIEKITPTPAEKPQEQPFLMPASTMILDDYFFVHRQVLAWRYLAGICQPKPGGLECKSTRSQFGVLIPRQRQSMLVSMEYVAKEKLTIQGRERDLVRLSLQMEDTNWLLWIDENNRLVRLLIPAEETEVLRD